MAGGRPSKFSVAYCNEVIQLMSQGYSFAACAGDLGVTRQTIYEWRQSIPEFSYAAELGEVKRQKWWENLLRSNAEAGTGNSGTIQFGLKNAAMHDFREKVEVETKSTVTIEDNRAKITAEVDALLTPTPQPHTVN